MVNENLSCVPTSSNNSQTPITDLQTTNRDNMKFKNENLPTDNPFNLPANVYKSGISNCTGDFQLGTRIITPNVIVLDRNKESLNDIENIIKGESDGKDISERKQRDYRQNDQISAKVDIQINTKTYIKTLLVAVMLVTMIVVVFLLLFLKINFSRDNSSDINLYTTITLETTTQAVVFNKSSFITQKECNDTQGEFCDSGELTTADKIKISYTANPCDTFNDCCESLRFEKRFDTQWCHYEDIHYHFLISENGTIYKGRSTECQIPLTYRECNESLLEVGIYIGSSGIICKNKQYRVEKQMRSLSELIEYCQNTGKLKNDTILLHFSNDSTTLLCTEKYTNELQKVFTIENISYYHDSSFCNNVCQ